MKKRMIPIMLAVLALTMTIPALAANFTPSVEGKEAPDVVPVFGESGNEVAAMIYDGQGAVVSEIPQGYLIVTPVSQAAGAEEPIAAALQNAYSQINGVTSLDELTDELAPALQDLSDEVAVEDLVVRDLFDVTLAGHYAAYLDTEGNSVTVRFDLSLDPDTLLLVLHNYSGEQWEVISNDQVTRHENGDVSVTFHSLSPVAFVVDGAQITVNPDDPTSPQTGESLPGLMIAGAMLFGGAAVGCFAFARKKETV